MVEKMVKEVRFNWRVQFYAAVGAFLLLLPLVISDASWGEIFYLFVAAPIVSLVLLIRAIRKKEALQLLSVISMLAVFWAVSAVLMRNQVAVRDTARWFRWSKGYKAQVLAQPGSASGELKHVEWDGWGFPGAGDTVVYLVFD